MKTCLVVDDSEVVRKVARRIFEHLKIDATEADSGQEALEGHFQIFRGMSEQTIGVAPFALVSLMSCRRYQP